MRQNSGLAHCIYPDRHWGYCCNYQLEIEYLKKFESGKKQELEIEYLKKFESGKKQELQKKELYLKLFKLIPNKLVPGIESKEWRSYVKAGQKFWKSKLFCIKAIENYNKLWQSYVTAKEAEDKAEEAYKGDSAYVKAKEVYYEAKESRIMAWEAYLEAWKAYKKARKAYYDALHSYDEALNSYSSKYESELQALHDEMFPDCPWDGETIF